MANILLLCIRAYSTDYGSLMCAPRNSTTTSTGCGRFHCTTATHDGTSRYCIIGTSGRDLMHSQPHCCTSFRPFLGSREYSYEVPTIRVHHCTVLVLCYCTRTLLYCTSTRAGGTNTARSCIVRVYEYRQRTDGVRRTRPSRLSVVTSSRRRQQNYAVPGCTVW